MAKSALSLTLRVAALFASVSLVGGIIGFGWEQTVYEVPEAPGLEALRSPEDAPEPAVSVRRSPEEEAVLKRALSRFPPYPRGGRPEVLAADYLGPKAPIAVAWLTTRDSPDQVLEYYRQVLKEKGLPAIGQRYNPRAGFVGYWSPESQEVFLVSVIAQGGETLVFVSAAQVAALVQGPAFVPQWLPLPPQLEQRMALSLSLEGATQHTASGLISTSSLREGADTYRALLAEQGWSVEAERQPEVNEVELEIRREGTQGTAVLKHTPLASRVQLFVSLRERP
jgi:hypothetical protein